MLKLKLLFSLASACVAAISFAQLDPNAVVATVNGDEIRMGDYFHRMEFYRIDPNDPLKYLPVGFLTLNQLITERLVFQMAKDKSVSPSQPEIDAEEKYEESKVPSIVADYTSKGLTEDDLKNEIAYHLAEYHLRAYGITITDQEVEDHYHKYPSEFTTDRRFRLRVIAVDDDASQAAADADLASGKSFADVASARSRDVTRGDAGELGAIDEGTLQASDIQSLQGVKIGQTTAWFRRNPQDPVRIKYLVEDIVPSKLLPLDDDRRRQIRIKLSIDKGNVKNTYLKDLQTATLGAKVLILRPGFQGVFDDFIKQYRNAHPNG